LSSKQIPWINNKSDLIVKDAYSYQPNTNAFRYQQTLPGPELPSQRSRHPTQRRNLQTRRWAQTKKYTSFNYLRVSAYTLVLFSGLYEAYKRVFGLTLNSESRPPTFIWEASQKRQEAIAKIRKEDDVEKNRTIAEEMADLVGRFCDLHTAEAHFGS
jgi:hypothetical protein